MMKVRGVAWVLVLGLLWTGCGDVPPRDVPEVADPEDKPDPDPEDKPDPEDHCAGVTTLDVPLRRLTRGEYDNTVRDLLGDDSGLAKENFVPDGIILGFPTPGPVTLAVAEDFQAAAEVLAAGAVEDLDALLPCDPALAGEAECAQAFVESFGMRAYRQPLTTDQVDRVMAVYTASADEGAAFEDRIRLVLTAMLQSPFFLYRLEVGSPNPVEGTENVVALSSWEVAGRLSYLLWASMPDDELFAAAANDALQTPEEIEAQARRMLAEPRAREAVTQFFSQWLKVGEIQGVVKDTQAYPDFDEELRHALQRETEIFIEEVLYGDEPTLETLLTARFTYADARLAGFYGIEGVRGEGFSRVALPESRPGGILGHASLLAAHASPSQTSPVLRGAFIRTRMLCQEIPDPPPELNVTPPDPEPGLTTRELYAQHTEDDYCAGCHQLMDPIGFGFEHYDAIGLYRAEEQGKPIDATGELVGAGDIDGPFDGVDELSERMAGSEYVRECVANQWFRYGFNRLESDQDTCTIGVMTEALADSNNDLRELLIALTRTESFRYRRAVQAVEGN